MTTNYHTPIVNGDPRKNDAEIWNDPLEELDAQVTTNVTDIATNSGDIATNAGNIATNSGDVSTLQADVGDASTLTTTSKVVVGAINEIDGEVGDVSTLTTEADTIIGAVNEINSRPSANAMWDPFNQTIDVGQEWNVFSHWQNTNRLEMVNDDPANPFQARTLRLTTAGASAGKRILFQDTGVQFGDTVTFKMLVYASTGSFYLAAREVDDAGVLHGTQTSGSSESFAGGATNVVTVTHTIAESNSVGISVYLVRAGGAADGDIYATWGGLGSIGPDPAPGEFSYLVGLNSATPTANTMWDPFHLEQIPGATWGNGDRQRWQTQTNLTIISPDSNNPYGANTLRVGTSSTLGGKKIWLDEAGLSVGQAVTFRALVSGTDGTAYLSIRPIDESGALIGTQIIGQSVAMGTGNEILSVYGDIEAGSVGLAVFVVRSGGGTTPVDVYAMWGGLGAPAQVPTANAQRVTNWPTIENQHLLRQWRAQIAKIQQGSDDAVIAFIGDSWVGQTLIHNPLTQWLQTTYGDAGPGYVGIGANHGNTLSYGVDAYSRVGTWVDLDNVDPGRGVDLADATSSDISTPGSVTMTATFTDAVIHYIEKTGGGDFRWQVDGGGWTTVNTVGGSDTYATTAINGLSDAGHTLEIEVLNAGTTGVTLCGVDLQEANVGVRVHRLGNGGATAANFASADATLFQAGISDLAPDVAIILLGTNDHSQNDLPSDFIDDVRVLVDNVRAARPTCDILMLTCADNGLDGRVYNTWDYADAFRLIARAEGGAVVDAWSVIGDYTTAESRGLYANTSHPNADGGQLIASETIKALRVWG